MISRLVSLFLFVQLALVGGAHAHNVWAHVACEKPSDTLEFYSKAGDVYLALEASKAEWSRANTHLEHGVLAEFENKINVNKGLKVYEFKNALNGYMRLRQSLAEFDEAVARVQSAESSCANVAKYENTLSEKLSDGRVIPRLSNAGVRFSNVAGLDKGEIEAILGTKGILSAWRQDLKLLTAVLDESIEGLRDAIPLAEKGEFAAVMLSGRNAFGDKLPKFTDMYSAFDRMYVMTVMATIQSTMEIYPAGYEWLRQ